MSLHLTSTAFTMDTYSHIINGVQEDAVVLLDGIMLKGVAPKTAVAKMLLN